jgi:ABC-type thiamin/hydroxymethylpyrimidine transport system permease subunit
VAFRPKFDPFDIVVVGILGAISGVFFPGLNVLWLSLVATAGWPTYVGAVLIPIFKFPGPLAYFLRRKPGINAITTIVQGVATVAGGSPFGVLTFGWIIPQALISEAFFTATRYRNFKLWLFAVGGAFTQINEVWTMILFNIPLTVFIPFLAIAMIFGAVWVPLLSYGLGGMVLRSGLIRTPELHELKVGG